MCIISVYAYLFALCFSVARTCCVKNALANQLCSKRHFIFVSSSDGAFSESDRTNKSIISDSLNLWLMNFV